MEIVTIIASIIGILGTGSSIYFAYLAVKKNIITEEKNNAKHSATIVTDISYIKECVNRVEQNLTLVDERNRNCMERLVKLEVSLINLTKRVDEIFKIEGG